MEILKQRYLLKKNLTLEMLFNFISYILCYKIVLMFYNGWRIRAVFSMASYTLLQVVRINSRNLIKKDK
jgi:hypothetical protein